MSLKLKFTRLWGSFRSGIRQTREYVDNVPWLKHTLGAAYWLPIGIAINEYAFTIKVVSGRSMQPTLNPDWSQWRDIVLFDRYSINTGSELKRGDIVAVASPVEQKLLIKRIIALPGDTVKTLPPYPDPEVVVPEGYIWIEGDESFRTDDSNRFGPVSMSLVDSRLYQIVWPLERFGPIPTPTMPTANPGEPRGQAWRQKVQEVDRDRWRRSRVKTADGSPP